MSKLRYFYHKILRLPLSLMVKSRTIPQNPADELGLELAQSIIYVLPYSSQTDVLILQKHCQNLGLPDPLEKNNINGQQLPRFVFLEQNQ